MTMSEEQKNEVATVFGGNVAVANSSALASALRDSADNSPRQGGGGDVSFLNFSGKRGLFSSGKENTVIQPDELFAVNIASFEEGWICWKGGKPVSRRSANIMDAPVQEPDFSQFGPFEKDGDGWFSTKTFSMKSVDTDATHSFSTSSVSGNGAVGDLLDQIATRASNGDPAWPLVNLDKEEFEAQGYKNFKPVFKPYGWLNDETVQGLANPENDVEDLIDATNEIADSGDPAPVDKQVAATGPEPESEPEATPRRRRRAL